MPSSHQNLGDLSDNRFRSENSLLHEQMTVFIQDLERIVASSGAHSATSTEKLEDLPRF